MKLVHRASRRRLLAAGTALALAASGAAVALGAGPTHASASHRPDPIQAPALPGAPPTHASASHRPDPIQAPALPGAPPIGPADRVYTADQTSNTVTVIDPSTRKVLGTIPFGDQRLGGDLGPQYLKDVDVHGLGSPATAGISTSCR